MDKKKFNRGSIGGGIAQFIITGVCIAVAVIVLSLAIKDFDKDDVGGSVFMFIICGMFFIFGTVSLIGAVKTVIDGNKSRKVKRNGRASTGKVVKLFEIEHSETRNGATSRYITYHANFEYRDDFDNLCESEEQISKRVFDKLGDISIIPILVYKERAIFNVDEFEKENFMK